MNHKDTRARAGDAEIPASQMAALIKYLRKSPDNVETFNIQQAADWFATNQGETTQAEREAFVKWLKDSRGHIQEYLGVASVAQDLRKAASAEDFALDKLIERAKADNVEDLDRPLKRSMFESRPAMRWAAVAASLAVVGTLGFFAWSAWNAQHAQLAHAGSAVQEPAVTQFAFATQRGQQSTERLPDGSVLHLNTDTAVSVRYSASRRDVLLVRGQANFEVIHDPQRVFRVTAGSAEVTDVGTRFDVNLENGATVVTVVEGLVEVSPSPTLTAEASRPRARPVKLSANQQLSVTAQEWPAEPKNVDAQRATAWLRRQIVFEHQPLDQVAAEFNRYAVTPIEIVTPSLRELQISGVFSTDDPEAFIAFLRSLDGVRVDVTPTRVLVQGKTQGKTGR